MDIDWLSMVLSFILDDDDDDDYDWLTDRTLQNMFGDGTFV